MSTHIGPVRSPIEWGNNGAAFGDIPQRGSVGSGSGSGSVASPDAAGSVRARRQSTRTREGSARMRRVRPYALASGLLVLGGEEVQTWAHPEGVTIERKLSVSGEATVVAAASRQCPH